MQLPRQIGRGRGRAKETPMHQARRAAFTACCAAGAGLILLLPRTASTQDLTQARLLTSAYNASGAALFGEFAPGNVVFSPYSIGTAMAMALAGARGQTEREMVAVLKQRLARPQIDAANATALSILNGYDKSAVLPACPEGMRPNGGRCESAAGANCQFPARREGDVCVLAPKYPRSARLAVANALMLTQQGGLVSKSYQALLKDKYAADVFQNATLDDVNAWVGRKTEGKIDRILDALDPNAAAVLLNAVYFKAKWASAFSTSATKDEAFNLAPERQISVPMMRKVESYASVARQGYRAIRLPYEVNALGMIIVVPDAIDGLGEVSGRLGEQELSQLLGDLRSPAVRTVVDLAMPRFKTSFKAELARLFRQAGMIRAFSLRDADFGGMTGQPPAQAPLAIDQIVHRAVIEVMEDGTEAAAATAVTMRTVSAPPRQPEVLRVDRPFLFYIVDDMTGAILFQGRIVDPR
jgi:serpin B